MCQSTWSFVLCTEIPEHCSAWDKGNSLYTKNASSRLLLEASIRKPGSNRLEQQGNLLSCIFRSPKIIQGSELFDLVTQ